MKIREMGLRVSAALAVAALLLIAQSGFAAAGLGYQDICTGNGGTWSGQSSVTGTCVYGPGNPVAQQNCGPNHRYIVTVSGGSVTGSQCVAINVGTTPVIALGCRTELRGPTEETERISICNGKNGSATFPPGSCSLKCTISQGLPNPAKKQLPPDAQATMYVRSVGVGGGPGGDNYTACFDLGDFDGDTPAMFRFVSGSWQRVSATISGKFICTAASGDGAFYLGEAPGTG